MKKAVAAAVVLAIIAAGSSAFYEAYLTPSGGGTLRSQLSPTTFGGVTEFKLPQPDRWSNAITSASDGSIWFAEGGRPGVAHFFPTNDTLVEYPWPGYKNRGASSASISGIAIWGGRVWAADEYTNEIVGLDPSDGSVVSVNSTASAPFPYWLAVGPDGNLWFTSDNFAGQPTRLGRIVPNMTVQAIDLFGLGNDQPLQLEFVNSTFALLSTIDEATNATTQACACTGHIYSFDPGLVGSTVAPSRVGGSYTLVLPASVAYSDGSVWVTQHGPSSVVRYDFGSRTWTRFPTSIVPWGTTLPYVVQTEGGSVWFNEHEANKIARLNPQKGTLTEYSETDPPITDPNEVQNDLSIAPTTTGLWFTSMTGDYIGFVSYGYDPGFGVQVMGNATAKISPGGNASFTIYVSGTWSRPMNVSVSDSEGYQSIPRLIRVAPTAPSILPGASIVKLGVSVSVGDGIAPGNYTLAVTVTNGDVQQTAYLFLVVE